MDIGAILAVVVLSIILITSIVSLRNFQFTTKKITRIGIASAMTIILYMIKLVPFPQGGGCSLLHIIPIVLVSVLYGMDEAIICGIIVATIQLIVAKPMFLLQIPLDYYGSMMAIGFASIFGVKNKINIAVGSALACALSVFCNILSGVLFFGQYAPEGMNPWVYSAIYNLSGSGLEYAISIAVILIIPLKVISKTLNKEEAIRI